jgi:hypothetical protein
MGTGAHNSGMAGKRRKKIDEWDVTGLKYFDRLAPLLQRLHEVGCQRDKAGNRTLHYDQYALLILLFFFNPVVTSLRGLQQASELKKVQRRLGCLRASLGSLSEATEVFDPERLREIVGELFQEAQPVLADRRLDCLTQTLTAVDGTLLARLPQIAQAAWQTRRDAHGWRLHTHFEILRGLPSQVTLTDGRNRGDSNEKNVLRQHLQADRCYVTDRGYEQFSLFNAIVDVGSSYVCRVKNDHHFQPTQLHPLTHDAQAAGVLSDEAGRFGSPNSKRIEHPEHIQRRIVIRMEPHEKRGGRHRGAASQDLVLATNLLDVPAEVIAILYRYRWSVEIFFRFFKHILGCRHLLSHDAVGIEIQTYCAIIACLLISLWTGRKPTLRTYEMICFYFLGLADEEELLAHIAKLPTQSP